MNSIGSGMSPWPHEWCSPIHASSKPSLSSSLTMSASRSYAEVGSCPTGEWKGAIKVPNLMRGMVSPASPDRLMTSLEACDNSAGRPATHGVLLWDIRGASGRRRDGHEWPSVAQKHRWPRSGKAGSPLKRPPGHRTAGFEENSADLLDEPSVYRQSGARDEPGLIRCQPDDGVGHVEGLDPADRHRVQRTVRDRERLPGRSRVVRLEQPIHVLVLNHVGVHRGRMQRVHPDAVLLDLVHQRTHQPDHA